MLRPLTKHQASGVRSLAEASSPAQVLAAAEDFIKNIIFIEFLMGIDNIYLSAIINIWSSFVRKARAMKARVLERGPAAGTALAP